MPLTHSPSASRARPHVLSSLLLPIVVAGCSATGAGDAGSLGDDAGVTVDAGPFAPVWQSALASDEASFSSVWGTAPDDVFVAGGDEDQGTIAHFDGAAWSVMDIPAVPPLTWVYGFASDDVLAVGRDGAALHYDGSSWTPLVTNTDADLWGVFGFAAGEAWVVGGEAFEGDPVLLRYDGAGFSAEALPATENPTGAHALFKVWGKAGRLFAVGQFGLILERDGEAWVRRPAGELADDDFVALSGVSADRVVAVGGRANARIATFDGDAWSTVAPLGIPGLNAVFMDQPDRALVAGLDGTAASFLLGDGSLSFEETGTRFELHALWGDGAGKHYAVGGTFFAPHRGVVLVRTMQPAEAP